MTDQKRLEEMVTRLAELKDTSETMMDLAYTALMFNNRELAEEVQRLEEQVDELHTAFELLVLKSDFTEEEASGFLGLIRIGVVAEKIADAAAEMAEVVLRGIRPHPVLRLMLKEAEETVIQTCVTPDSTLVNKTLKDAQIHEETGMWVQVIRRGPKTLRPKGDSKILEGDVLIATGYIEGADALRKLASPQQTCNLEEPAG